MRDTSPIDRYAVPLRRWWPVVVGAVLAGWVAVWFTLPEAPTEPTPEEIADPTITYRATHVLLRDSQSPAAPQFELVQLLARQGDLTNRVVERLDGEVSAMDVDAVTLEPNEGIGTLSVTAVQPDPDLASRLATTFAEELSALLAERNEDQVANALAAARDRAVRLSDQIQELESEIQPLPEDDLDRRLLEAELEAALNQYASQQQEIRRLSDQQTSPAPPFETLSEPSPVSTLADAGPSVLEVPQGGTTRFALGTVVALVLGVGAVFAIDHIDTRVRTRRDAEDAFGLPVVAEFPRRSAKDRSGHPLPVRSEPDGATAEAFRSLRLAVLVSPTWHLSGQVPTGSDAVGSVAAVTEHEAPQSLLVTSPLTGDGKSTLVANLAASFAGSDQGVLVIDCDFRRPAVAEMLGVKPGEGLRDLEDPHERPLKDLVVTTSLQGIDLVRSGEPGVAPPWFVSHSRAIVEQAVDLADVVVIDTGPVLLTNEALALIPAVDTTLLVARARKVSFGQARDTIERLTRVNANVAGIALIGGEGGSRYGYYEPTKERPSGPGIGNTARRSPVFGAKVEGRSAKR
jgi:Mrp family chromosome partitioning ATPase/capsular polysaccharide biosynthesis protein